MIKFIIDENPRNDGVYLMHSDIIECEDMPLLNYQILIGYFSNFELALKRARMNWPKEKITGCSKCCDSKDQPIREKLSHINQ